LEFLTQNLIAIIALSISVATFFIARRGMSYRAKEGISRVEREIQELNIKLEAKVQRLNEGLDRCIKERIGFKDEIQLLRKALKAANIEIEELKSDSE
jgi:uncharacterized protein YydD (DUF2326 family)